MPAPNAYCIIFGKVIANGATNVIPNEVKIEGTFRTMDEPWRAEAHRKMKKMAEQMAEAMGGSCEFEIRKGYPYLQNNPELTKKCTLRPQEYLGAENVVDLDIWMAAEDFAYYTQQVDACFYRLGTETSAEALRLRCTRPHLILTRRALENRGWALWLGWHCKSYIAGATT
jgi:metal-dependent amidase/aminoacylase/carboxypeptidase family protein